MTKATHDKIVELIGRRAFGRVMSNLTRPIYVEGMVALLLGSKWRYLGDWDGWDMERDDGKRLEVKLKRCAPTLDPTVPGWKDEARHHGSILPRAMATGWTARTNGSRHLVDTRTYSSSPIIRCLMRSNATSAIRHNGASMFCRLQSFPRAEDYWAEALNALDAKEVL